MYPFRLNLVFNFLMLSPHNLARRIFSLIVLRVKEILSDNLFSP